MTVPNRVAGWFLLAAAVLSGCEKTEPAPGKAPETTGAATEASRAKGPSVELRAAPAGEDVGAAVRRELERAQAQGRQLLVYVGASWCEPCMRFHRAVEAGQLEGQLPAVTLLEFDKDRDDDRLKAAGYTSRLIPLFAVPKDDGTSSGKQMEGSIKGEGAVGEITPRLRRLLGQGG